jgi:NAD(P)-dependent dehydrogenase (short-subunit alcohol dehydrogenase family)
MGTYAVTGSDSGMGAATAAKLTAQGHRVLRIDQHRAEIVADLATEAGRSSAAAAVAAAAPEGLDGYVAAAGLGPHQRPVARIMQTNFFGAADLTERLRPSLAKRRGSVVLISSNSATLGPFNADFLKALDSGDEAAAVRVLTDLGDGGYLAYAGSKHALIVWMRQHMADFLKDGIRMNVVAPGVTDTPMFRAIVRDPEHGAATAAFSDCIPMGRYGQAEDQANGALFLLSPEAAFVCGTVLFVDGGHDAMLRPTQF